MERTSDECGLKHCTLRPPLISNSTHEESSWPDTRSRPEGSTHTAATGEPCVMKHKKFVLPCLHSTSLRHTAYLPYISHTFNPFQSNFSATCILPSSDLFWAERGWWITCNYLTVLKEKNINGKSKTCGICWPKSILHEAKENNRKIIMSDEVRHRIGKG
jgi:hypothetical protein